MFQHSKRSKMIETDSIKDSVENDTSEININNGLVANGVAASVTVSLHPLVIMNICDHFTRIKAQGGTVPKGFPFYFVKRSFLSCYCIFLSKWLTTIVKKMETVVMVFQTEKLFKFVVFILFYLK